MNFRVECSLPWRWKLLKVIKLFLCIYDKVSANVKNMQSVGQQCFSLLVETYNFGTLALALCWGECRSHALIWGVVL